MAKAEISNRVRELRQASGEMTQQELADRVGVTRQTIGLIEAGRYNPTGSGDRLAGPHGDGGGRLPADLRCAAGRGLGQYPAAREPWGRPSSWDSTTWSRGSVGAGSTGRSASNRKRD